MCETQSESPPVDSTQSAARLLDPADELYRLWQMGAPPELDAYLAASGPISPGELAAGLSVDQRCRWAIGQSVPAERYLAQYPKLLDAEESAIDFIYGELLLRERHGERPGIDEFVARFPDLGAILRKQIKLHRA